MKTDVSWLDEKPRMLSTSRGLKWAGGLVVAVAIVIGSGFATCEVSNAEAGQSEVRVVRASVSWQEGGRVRSVVHVAEPVREAPPRLLVRHDERRTRFDDPIITGREIRTGVAVVTMLVRLLASGKMDG